MQRAGTVVSAVQGLAIVRAQDDTVPDIGAEVVDESLDAVGTVVDVFGPVERPYLAVNPAEDQDPAAVIGQLVYAR